MSKTHNIPLPKRIEVKSEENVCLQTGKAMMNVEAKFVQTYEPAPIIVNESSHCGPWLHVNSANGNFPLDYYKANKAECVRKVLNKLMSDYLDNCVKMFLPNK